MKLSMTSGSLKVGIIGTGAMGRAFARQLSALRHEVTIANSRGAESLRALGAELGAQPGSVWDAVRGREVVFLATPTKAVPALPRGLFHGSNDAGVLIDVCNYHPELRDGRIDAIERGMVESEWVAEQIGRPVIKAFNSIVVESLLAKAAAATTQDRVALPIAGDSPDAKACVARLVDQLGFDAVDAGGLHDSWRQQTGAPAYCKDLDATSLARALASAERSLVGQYRAAREAALRAGSAR